MSAARKRKGRSNAPLGDERKASPVLFTRVKRTRSFEDVVEQIRLAISEGRLTKGDRLPNERELCGVFGISRQTLREGLRTLEALGVIETRPGAAGGIFVLEPGADQIGSALEALICFRAATAQDLAEFRVGFEGETAYVAAVRATESDIAELDRIASDFASLAELDDLPWKVLAEPDIEFHNAIARASQNQVRVAIMLGIHKALYRASISIGPLLSPSVRDSIASDLRDIAEAVREHDAPRARARMRSHVEKFSQLERLIEEKGIEGVAHEIDGVELEPDAAR